MELNDTTPSDQRRTTRVFGPVRNKYDGRRTIFVCVITQWAPASVEISTRVPAPALSIATMRISFVPDSAANESAHPRRSVAKAAAGSSRHPLAGNRKVFINLGLAVSCWLLR